MRDPLQPSDAMPAEEGKPVPLDYQAPRRSKPGQPSPEFIVRLADAQPMLRRTRRIIHVVIFLALLVAAAFAVRFMIGYAKMLDQAGK